MFLLCLRIARSQQLQTSTARKGSATVRGRRASSPAPANISFGRDLPMFDPDHFADVGFFRELEAIGYERVLLGGTGTAGLTPLVADIRRETSLKVVLYPGCPAAVTEANLIVLPDVMNSNSPQARPFGSGPVATAAAIAMRGLSYVPVAYYIMGPSTAAWFYDAVPLPSDKVLHAHAQYAAMLGYRYLALDYEGPGVSAQPRTLCALTQIPQLDVIVSDDFSPQQARAALSLGVATVITPSNSYEDIHDPLRLAADMHRALLAP